MKTLNQYIKESLLCKAIYNESILDDEDDLINNSSIEIIKKFIKDNYNMTGKLDIKESNNIYIVNCNGDVEVSNIKIEQLTNDFFEWGVVKGDFYCFGCKSLKSLQGAPKKVDGHFYCFGCASLTTLQGAPEKVGGSFNCSNCKSLKSLKGAPEKVDGSFICSYCESLTSLKGAPKEVGENFNCNHCKIQFTKDDVKKVSKVKGEIIQ